VLEIELLEAGLVPRFRITRDGRPARLLTVMVQPIEGGGPIWALGPLDMLATVTEGLGHEERQASAQEMRELEDSAKAALGDLTAEVLEVSYGSAPTGLHQVVPEEEPAPALHRGRRYLVFAAGPVETGSAEFTA